MYLTNKLQADPGLKDVVDFWELQNEPLGGGSPTWMYVNLAHLMLQLMARADAIGVKLLLFTFNAGCPEWADMQGIAETGVFARAKAGGHALGLNNKEQEEEDDDDDDDDEKEERRRRRRGGGGRQRESRAERERERESREREREREQRKSTPQKTDKDKDKEK